MMIFDTDVFIWAQRGNKKAANMINKTARRYLSAQTYMELFQCATAKKQHKIIRSMLSDFNFSVLPFTENISHRASILVEQYTLSTSLRAGDAIIAATAIENDLPLCSCNKKHFKEIPSLQLKILQI